MEKVRLTFIGIDSWDRPVYRDEKGRLWKDTSLGRGNTSLCSAYDNDFEGEPDMPIEFSVDSWEIVA